MNDFPDIEVVQIFNIIADMAEGAQSAYLAQMCAGRPTVRRQVERLLALDRDRVGDGGEGPPWRRLVGGEVGTIRELAPVAHLGTVVGNYRIGEVIGRGGMGIVYAAEHETLDRRAVVKVLAPRFARDEFMCQQFINEARAAARITHPGIVAVFDVGQLPGSGELFILMEHLQGVVLAERMHRQMPLRRESILPFASQMFDALAAVHAADIVHCDLKPDNMFIVPDPAIPGGERIKLLDFGIAHMLSRPDDDLALASHVVGTPPYMAPEQWLGQSDIDHRADLYAMGVILFQFVTGRRPFECRTKDEYKRAHMFELAPPLSAFEPRVWPELARLVSRLLSKRPADRYPSAHAVCEELKAMAHCRHSDRFSLDSSSDPLSGVRAVSEEVRVVSASVENVAAADAADGATDADGDTDVDDDADTAPDGSLAPDIDVDTLQHAASDVANERVDPVARGSGRVVAAVAATLLVVSALGMVILLVAHQTRPAKDPPTASDYLHLLQREFDVSGPAGQEEIVECIRLAAPIGAASIIRQALERGSAPVLMAAAHAVSDLQWPDMTVHVRRRLARVGGAARVHLAAAMAELGDWQSLAILERALNDPMADVRLRAAYGMALAGRTEVAAELRKRVDRSRPGTDNWVLAQRGLLAVGDPDARAMLRSALASSSPDLQVLAASLLAPYDARAGDASSAGASLRRMVTDPDFTHRGQAALALARAGHTLALGYVSEALTDPRPGERRLAIAVASRLAHRGGQKFAQTIADLAEHDPEPTVRVMARVATIAFPDERDAS